MIVIKVREYYQKAAEGKRYVKDMFYYAVILLQQGHLNKAIYYFKMDADRGRC